MNGVDIISNPLNPTLSRVRSVNGLGAAIVSGIGAVGRFAAPALKIVLPIGIGIGTEFLMSKLIPKQPAAGASTPAVLESTSSDVRSQQHESNINLTVGIVAVAAIAVVFLATRRRK